MSNDLCQEAAKCTFLQAEDNSWHQMRFGRITASKLYTAAHYKTENASFVQQVRVAKLRDTKAMKRGRILEKCVLETLDINLGHKCTYVGIMLSKRNSMFGASPDALFKYHVVEVKCPSSTATVHNYITANNEITAKYKAQVQLQMHILQKYKCIFAVADPDFEQNKKVTTISVAYDEKYVTKIMSDAEVF
ncbi:hypothetical protein ILUMI_26779 [Ignelater luminosus]|uniref:YqaJ viral recombinase domain-containing protein n=1 Tax=Ignelater luminosus TaxID=2038154 RepID=A0A8K0C433_IGNLU|nr:hypothetical protein ILUMI_26779 [Ignelater luminosus]